MTSVGDERGRTIYRSGLTIKLDVFLGICQAEYSFSWSSVLSGKAPSDMKATAVNGRHYTATRTFLCHESLCCVKHDRLLKDTSVYPIQ